MKEIFGLKAKKKHRLFELNNFFLFVAIVENRLLIMVNVAQKSVRSITNILVAVAAAAASFFIVAV